MIFFLKTNTVRNMVVVEALIKLLKDIPKKLVLKRKEFLIIPSAICSLQIRFLTVVYKQLINLQDINLWRLHRDIIIQLLKQCKVSLKRKWLKKVQSKNIHKDQPTWRIRTKWTWNNLWKVKWIGWKSFKKWFLNKNTLLIRWKK